nr:hypothetical protein [Tanacetum cinerariifolium]
MGEAAPKPKASARKKKGDSASSTTPLTLTATTTAESALRLSATAKGKQPLRATTPVEPTDLQRTEAEQLKIGGDEVRESEGESEEEEETSDQEEGSFDPIPRTPKDSEKESDDEEEQESRLSEEARIQEEEDAEELDRDVNINQGMGLQVTQNIKDTHMILTPVNPDDPQESSSMLSFVSSMLNPLSDVGVESIFATTSSQIVS